MSLKLFLKTFFIGKNSSTFYLCSRTLPLRNSANLSSPSEKLKPPTNLSVKEVFNADPKTGQLICTEGWVRSIRSMKQKTFIHLNDGTCFDDVQVVMPSNLCPLNATFGSCIKVHGSIKDSKAAGQKLELQATKVTVVGECDNETYPIKARQNHSMDYLRSFPHLRARTRTFSSLSRVRSAALYSAHQFFQERGFEYINTPILTSNDCEGGGEVFVVQPMNSQENNDSNNNNNDGSFFGKPVYLTVSGQLHLEVMAASLTQAYTIGPTFRAENNQSRHHLCEFTMVEAEVAKSGVVMKNVTMLMEHLIKHMTSHVMKRCPRDVEYFCREDPRRMDFIDKLINSEYISTTYDEVMDILSTCKRDFGSEIVWGTDLNKKMEKYLSDCHFDHVPFFIKNFPAKYINKDKTKPFYTRLNDDGKTGASCDLLLGGVGEVCGGGLREERVEMLRENIISMNKNNNNENFKNNKNNNYVACTNSNSSNLNLYTPTSSSTTDLDWYIDLRKYGGRRSGGFGLGFERYMQALLGVQSIKDVLLFPRSAKLCRL